MARIWTSPSPSAKSLRLELAAAKAERDGMTAKLDLLSTQMEELLRRTSSI
jgi:hypothetical protein